MADDLDDIFVDGTQDEEDSLDAIIHAALDKQDAPDDDDAGLDQPPLTDDQSDHDSTVSAEEAARLASDANLNRKPAKAEQDAASDEKPKPEGDKDGDDTVAADDADYSAAPVADLIKDLPEAQRTEVVKRMRAADEALRPFQTPYAQSQLAQFGATPAQMSERLVRIAAHAQEDPADYLAWAVKSMAAEPGKEIDVLNAAAEKLGMKVVQDVDEDADLFEDPKVLAMKRRLDELEATAGGKIKGPDSPERQQQDHAQREYHNFVNETDAAGNLKRPYYNTLRPVIEQSVQNYYNQTGRRVTTDELGQFYDHAVQQMTQQFGANPAAQSSSPVAEGQQKQAAASQKAKRASKNIDGAGQGALRRPVQSDDLDAVIRAAIAGQI